MDEHFDWQDSLGWIVLGLGAMTIGSLIFSRRRAARGGRSSRIRSLLTRIGILPKRRHARVGPIQVPEMVEEIPEAFLRAFR